MAHKRTARGAPGAEITTKRMAEVRNGTVVAVGSGSASAEVWASGITVPAGSIMIEVPDDGVEYLGRSYDAARRIFGTPPTPVPTRAVSTARYFDLFTVAERAAIWTLLDGGDMVVRDLWARVQLADTINLLSPRVATGLAYLESVAVFGKDGVARMAAIRANEDPA